MGTNFTPPRGYAHSFLSTTFDSISSGGNAVQFQKGVHDLLSFLLEVLIGGAYEDLVSLIHRFDSFV